ncbi:MAG: AAA family ATPase, partial [Thaumarchaeota archaeon]|nr:AAA family ATPase [Nitrososphaerota archaeon]
YKLRSSRIAELEAEREEIIRFIEWVEGEKKRIFMEAFNRVADAFEEYFTRLTGGRGWLRLENFDNPFEGGVEMILAFPGKQPRSSRAASGGEKSVAAVALLLALQGLTPAEFYVFDEVDAHMDLQYTKRLADLLKEMAKNTQIIVISLKDVVVSKADQVVGVYNKGGASRIVKTRLKEVEGAG